jgi:hypothetical protein
MFAEEQFLFHGDGFLTHLFRLIQLQLRHAGRTLLALHREAELLRDDGRDLFLRAVAVGFALGNFLPRAVVKNFQRKTLLHTASNDTPPVSTVTPSVVVGLGAGADKRFGATAKATASVNEMMFFLRS